METELFDWELVQGTDTESTDSIASEKKWGSSSVIDDGMILSPDNPSLESVRNEIGFSDGEVKVSDLEAADENHAEVDAVADDESHVAVATECADDLQFSVGRRHVESQIGVGEPIEDPSNSCSDSGGNQLVSSDSGIGSDSEAVEESGEDAVVRGGDDSTSREAVWWKMPFVLVKYCAFRIGPVWSVSMAAALMGFVLLGRRLYNMKKKPQRIHLKVAIDYKKVSQVMRQAARLNEAFTEVRRVPVIRPALPAPGAWPVFSLR